MGSLAFQFSNFGQSVAKVGNMLKSSRCSRLKVDGIAEAVPQFNDVNSCELTWG